MPNLQNQNIQKLIMAVLTLLALLFLFLILFIGKLVFYGGVTQYNPPSITVSATGEAKAVPNIATFNFASVESGKDVNEAQSKMAEIANKAISYLKSNGVEDKDIQTTGYSANPKYTYNPTTGKQVLEGYEARENITVKVRDASKAGELLGGVGQFKVSELSGLSFESEDKNDLKDKATEDATVKAKQKAMKLAEAGDFKLGKIISFYAEGEGQPPFPMPMYDKAMEARVTSVAPDIQVGENTITATVSITYEIK